MQTYEAFKFELKGKSAFFKKPDANAYAYFTYNNIHKIALLGLLGAVLGYDGYNQQSEAIKRGEKQVYPEFYSQLRDLKVCIIPNAKGGYFSKKLQQFNNSVGYASQEEGGNLIVREQWLEDPSWTIYILNEGNSQEVYRAASNSLLSGQCIFIPYLGKNDHPATIERSSIVKLEPAVCDYFTCLFPVDAAEINSVDTWDETESGFLFKEFCPYVMNENMNFYEFREFVFTNFLLKQSVKNDLTFAEGENRLMFY